MSQDTSALFKTARAWETALVRGDVASLDEILADLFVDTSDNGQVSDKRQIMADLTSGTLKFTSLEMLEERFISYGSTAIAIGIAAQAGTYRGKPLTARVAFTDCYFLDGSRWRAVAAAHTAAPG